MEHILISGRKYKEERRAVITGLPRRGQVEVRVKDLHEFQDTVEGKKLIF